MNTTLNEIREYGPCKPEWDRLLKSLGKTKADNEPLSFKHILESTGIENAIWCLRVLPYIDTCLFRADMAKLVLHIFEVDNPDDNRPRLAIEAIRDFHSGKITEAELESFSEDASTSSSLAAAYASYASSLAAFAASSATNTTTTATYTYTYTTATTQNKQWKVIEELFIKHFGQFSGKNNEHNTE